MWLRAALVVIPIFVAATTAATLFVIGWPVLTGYPVSPVPGSWAIAFIVALAHALLLGLPAYFIVRWLHLTAWWLSLICGFIIGAGPSAIAVAPFPPADMDLADYAQTVAGLGVLGMVSAFAAWLTWHHMTRRAFREP